MGVYASGEVERRVEPLFLVFSKACLSDLIEACVHELDIAVAKCIVNNPFVFFN
jgi:hypothetical protein